MTNREALEKLVERYENQLDGNLSILAAQAKGEILNHDEAVGGIKQAVNIIAYQKQIIALLKQEKAHAMGSNRSSIGVADRDANRVTGGAN